MKRLRILFLVFFVLGCQSQDTKRSSKNDLTEDLRVLDSLMARRQSTNRDIDSLLLKLKVKFPYSTNRSLNSGPWKSSVNFGWDADSSISIITSSKRDEHGLKKETIIHSNDSILFIKRFSVSQALDTIGYFFVESYDFVTENGSTRTLIRMHNYADLGDSIKLRKLPFKAFNEKIENQYEFELDYAKNILTRN